MSDHTHIEWTDATWNPITGCSVVSAGCKHCYAMKLAGTRLKHTPSRKGLTIDTAAGPVWNGKVRFNEQWLDQPLRWKAPRKIFVCAHGDLFHESVPDEWIDQIFAVMLLAQQHTFQVLTKRPERMLEYLTTKWQPAPAHRVELPDGEVMYIPAEKVGDTREDIVCDVAYEVGRAAGLDEREDFWRPDESTVHMHTAWPLPNVWLGVSVENQDAANERIPMLLQTPAAVRWISAEPLLRPISLQMVSIAYGGDGPAERYDWLPSRKKRFTDVGRLCLEGHEESFVIKEGLDWVVVGGESGTGARPMHPDWARSLRDQCVAAGMPFLFKQWGEWEVASAANGHHGSVMPPTGEKYTWLTMEGNAQAGSCQNETAYAMAKVGKKKSGRLLDGVQHDGYPNV